MPLYEFECEACGQRFEVIRKFSDPPLDVCKECGEGPIKRLPSSPAIQFKGSGFYITDYKNKKADNDASAKKAESKDKGSSKADGPAKSDAGKSDAGKSAPSKGE